MGFEGYVSIYRTIFCGLRCDMGLLYKLMSRRIQGEGELYIVHSSHYS